jgi:hypothetical protein
MLTYLIGALIVAVCLIIAVALLKADEFRISRSIVIDAPAERIFPLVNDLRSFSSWSPYDLKDPDMQRKYTGSDSGKGAVYAWQGDSSVGKGWLEISESQPFSLIAIDLHIEKPMAADNAVTFTFEPKGSETTATWAMRGRTPFLGKIMHLIFNVEKMIGGDFELGLRRLKAAAESR